VIVEHLLLYNLYTFGSIPVILLPLSVLQTAVDLTVWAGHQIVQAGNRPQTGWYVPCQTVFPVTELAGPVTVVTAAVVAEAVVVAAAVTAVVPSSAVSALNGPVLFEGWTTVAELVFVPAAAAVVVVAAEIVVVAVVLVSVWVAVGAAVLVFVASVVGVTEILHRNCQMFTTVLCLYQMVLL